MIRTIGAPGMPFEEGANAVLLTNRTGATTVKGGTGFIDLPQADADSTSLTEALKNVVAVTTALIAYSWLVLAKEAGVADNADGRWLAGEGVIGYANVDSTTDVAKGDALKPVNGGDHMVKATKGTDRWFAIALEAKTADSEAPLKVLLFSSGRF